MPSNSGHAVDSAGNIQVDFVWGNFPAQPNDVRTTDADTTNTYRLVNQLTGSTTNNANYSAYDDNHDRVLGGYAGYPLFSTGVKDINNQYQGDVGKFTVGFTGTTYSTTATQATVGSYSIVVASAANLAVGMGVASTGYIPVGAFVTSISGTTIGISLPTTTAMSTTAVVFGTDGNWAYTPNIVVPNVLGLATVSAQDGLRDAGYTNGKITTAAGATNTATTITRVNVTAAGVAAIYATSADTNYPTGTKVTIVAGTGIPAAVVGTWSVTGSAGAGQITIAGAGWTVADSGVISAASTLTGTSATIKTQSVAANAAGIDGSAAITITPWA